MPAPYDGGCACGSVRYRLNEEPLTLYVCHCTDCQALGGSGFGMSMPVREEALEILRGEPRGFRFTTPEGREKGGQRCDACSSRLWGEPVALPQIAILRPGTLDDRSWLRPVAHIWTDSAQPWVSIPSDVLRYPRQPEGPAEMLRAWQRR